jgi:molybdenum cofactor biosynthesis protein B
VTAHEAAPGDRHHLHGQRSLRWGVLSVSDTRSAADDVSGRAAESMIESAGHSIAQYALVANRVADIQGALEPWLKGTALEAVVTIGGTGVGARDLTVTTLESMGGRLLPGFGELYRSISFAEVGALAMISRSGLFLIHGKPVFALPGSERAVRTALERLILPGVQHLVEELER